MRNGIRTPASVYPNSLYNLSYWSQYGGLNRLLPIGMNYQYQFGQFVRNNYQNFLSSVYDPSKVKAKSTDFDTTLSSAYTFLAGLYRPSTNQIWNVQYSNWYPIPVFTNSRNTDQVIQFFFPSNFIFIFFLYIDFN